MKETSIYIARRWGFEEGVEERDGGGSGGGSRI